MTTLIQFLTLKHVKNQALITTYLAHISVITFEYEMKQVELLCKIKLWIGVE
jgi:hypothetical protein